MITIQCNGQTLKVTLGAYNSIYKPMGFSPVHMAKMPKTPDMDPEEEMDEEVETEDAELGEKPLSEMNFNELKEYAAQLGISTNGMRTRRELKAAIQQAEQ